MIDLRISRLVWVLTSNLMIVTLVEFGCTLFEIISVIYTVNFFDVSEVLYHLCKQLLLYIMKLEEIPFYIDVRPYSICRKHSDVVMFALMHVSTIVRNAQN